MADLRIGQAVPAVRQTGAATPAGAEVARAAQRAFFQAALGQHAPVAPTSQALPLGKVEVAAAPNAPSGVAQSANASPPTRLLRPGSLVDIRV